MALRDLASKSALDTCDTFKEVLADLSKAKEGEKNPIGVQILVAIIRSMTDNARTEVKTMQMIEDYINETLPLVRVSFDLNDMRLNKRSVGLSVYTGTSVHLSVYPSVHIDKVK